MGLYGTKISLEHCVHLLSCLSSIENLIDSEQYEFFIYKFCQGLLTFWQIHVLHDVDADDWHNTKSYMENNRYSLYIDSLFDHFHRFHSNLQKYCPSLIIKVIPFTLLELMNFISHRYSSIKISYARQSQYKVDLLAFLVHISEFTHYFFVENKSEPKYVLLQSSDQQ